MRFFTVLILTLTLLSTPAMAKSKATKPTVGGPGGYLVWALVIQGRIIPVYIPVGGFKFFLD